MAPVPCQISSVAPLKQSSSKEEDIEEKVSSFINEFFGIAVASWPRHTFDETKLQADKSRMEISPSFVSKTFESCTVPSAFEISEGNAATFPLQRLDSFSVKSSCAARRLDGLLLTEDCSRINHALANEKDLEAALSCTQTFGQVKHLVEATKHTFSHSPHALEGVDTTIDLVANTTACVSYAFSHHSNSDRNLDDREGGTRSSKFHTTEKFSRAVDLLDSNTASLCLSKTGYVIKPSSKKPPKPPRPQSLEAECNRAELRRYLSDGEIIRRVQRSKRERMQLKRKKTGVPTSNATSFWALLITLCFAILVVVQGLMSRGNADPKELESSSKITNSYVIMHGKVLPYREAILYRSSEHRIRANIGKSEAESTVAHPLQHNKEARQQLLQALYVNREKSMDDFVNSGLRYS